MQKKRIRKMVTSLILALSMILAPIITGLGTIPVEAAGSAGENLALGKPVTASQTGAWNSIPNRIVDGNNQANDDNSFFITASGEKYVTIDLEEVCEVSSIRFYGEIPADSGYYNTPHNQVIMLSQDPDFKDDSTVIVLNTDDDNSLGFGAGSDEDQVNTREGRLITFETVQARYVRYYQEGATQLPSPGNLPSRLGVCEIEVYGPAVMENLALSAAASATTTYENNAAGYGPNNAIDGKTDTAWASYCKQGVAWDNDRILTLKWSNAISVDELKLLCYCNPNYADDSLIVEYTFLDADDSSILSGSVNATGEADKPVTVALENEAVNVKTLKLRISMEVEKGNWNDAVGFREVEVYGSGDPGEVEIDRVPAGNLAYGLVPAFGDMDGNQITSFEQGNRIPQLTSGVLNSDNWVSPAKEGPAYMQLDLGKVRPINQIKTWEFYKDNARWFWEAVQISGDGENWKTLYNNDSENAGGLQSLGTNPEGVYNEMYCQSAQGNTINFPRENARYVRFWSGGYVVPGVRTARNPLWVQLQVYNNYSVTFDLNYPDGTESEDTVALVPEKTSVERPDDPVCEAPGYIFKEWTLDGAPYDFGAVTQDMVLEAEWENVGTCNVTFDYHDGVTEALALQVTKGMTVVMPENPEREGYYFAGWKWKGIPFVAGQPITEDVMLDAYWVPVDIDREAVIHAGMIDLYFNHTGQITNIIGTLDGIDYAPADEEYRKSWLITLIADDAHHTPTSMTYNALSNVLSFEFATINTQVDVKLEQKGSYTTFTVEKLIAPENVGIETLLWGPIKTTINEVVGESLGVAYDSDFAIGLHDLNDKTIGGWPQQWNSITYPPGYTHQDNTYLSGMSWQAQAAVVADRFWGGSFLQSFTNDYTRPTERIVGGWAWVNNDKVDQTNFEFGKSFHCIAHETVPSLLNSMYPEDAYIEGSSIALFGCKSANILNTVEEIELGENLPHPTVNGQWQKTASPALGSYVKTGSLSTGNVDAVTRAAAEAGISYVYNIVGAVGPFDSNGSYRFNSAWGHSDQNAQDRMCDVAAANGVYLGVHSMSAYVNNGGGNDPLYVTDYGAHPDLAYAQTTVLTRPVKIGDTTIFIADGTNFGAINRDASGKYLRIGSEIISYSNVEKVGENEWKISGCSRGARGTANYISSYEEGASVARLWLSQYSAFIGGANLANEIALREAQAFNNSGIRDMSCDGLEDVHKNGYNELAVNRYASTLYWNCNNKDGFYFVNSVMCANQWDMLSREDWNRSVRENLPNFNLSAPSDQYDPVTDSRAYMMQRNLFPLMYSVDTGSERDLSLVAALDAGFMMGDVSGLSSEQRASIRAWKDAMVNCAFSEQQKQDFLNAYYEDRSASWHMTAIEEGKEWLLRKLDGSGAAVGDAITLKAGGRLNVEDSENGNVATRVSIENVTGINPDYTNKIKAAFAGTVVSAAQPGETIIVSPMADMGYELASLTVKDASGNEIEVTESDSTYHNYEFRMPESGDVTIIPEFVPGDSGTEYSSGKTMDGLGTTHTIAVDDAIVNGTIRVEESAAAGGQVTVTATADEGYRFKQIGISTDNYEPVVVAGNENGGTFTMPNADIRVTAVFVPTYGITVDSAIENGTVTAGVRDAAEGDNVVIAFAADSQYKLTPGSLIVKDADGAGIPITVTADTSKYEFTMPASDVTITAKFEPSEARTVSTQADANMGTITVDGGAASAHVNDKISFTVTPNEGYSVSSVYALDGSGNQMPLDENSAFKHNSNLLASMSGKPVTASFTMADGNVTICAYFEESVSSADKTDLTELYDSYKDTENESYTEESWNAFRDALKNAEDVLADEDAAQDDIDAAAKALQDAAAGLEKKEEPADAASKELLQKAYDYALTLSIDNVVSSAVKAFENAKAEAKAVLDNPEATQEEVDAAWDNLLNGIWGLGIVKGDKTNLELLIAKAESMIENGDRYVVKNWQQLVSALENAKNVDADGDALTEDIEPAAEELLNAILIQRFKANKSNLQALVNRADSIDTSVYTLASVAVFRMALANAETVLGDESLSLDDQAAVDGAAKDLLDAIDNLEKIADGDNAGDGDNTGDAGNTGDGDNTGSTGNNSENNTGAGGDTSGRTNVSNPKTGDNANLLIWFGAILFASALCAAAVVVKKRMKIKNKEVRDR